MPGFLKQATAAQSRAIGPFVSDTDFKTVQTGLTIANTDVKLVVNGGASANKNSGGGTHRVNGVYGFTFDATDTATVGEIEVSIVVAGALVVFDKFFVVEEAIYDALFAASANGFAGAAGSSTVVFSNVSIATVTTVTNQLTAAAIATGVWQDATAGDFTTANSIGKALYIANVVPGGAGGHFISGSNAGTTTFAALTVTGATTLTGNVVLSDGLTISAPSTGNRAGLDITGNGTGAAVKLAAGATGKGIAITTTAGDGLSILPTAGSAIVATGNGTSKHGIIATGGTAGTSDGATFVAGSGGVDLRANITGNLIGTVSTLTTYTGNTPQTGDAFLRIGAAGVSLTAIPWNAAWDAEVQSEVDDALIVKGLDHLVFASVAGTDIADNSVFAKLVSKSATADWDDFVNTTESLQALRDRGDAAWITATGFAIAGDAMTLMAAYDAAKTAATQASVNTIDGIVDNILLDTAEIGAAGVGLSAIPWNADWDAEVQSEVTDALNAYDPPTRAELTSDIDSLPTATENATAVGTRQITESYRANGAAPTLDQALSETLAHLGEATIVGTTKTINKVDHVTAAETFTLDSATAPTSITRAS